MTATFAPAIGPTIGGYLTDYYGWPWVFYVNLAPGLVMLTALSFTLPKSAPQLGLLRQGDWFGIALMALGLAAFQTVLDDGNVYNWFDSPFIVKLSLVAALALGGFVAQCYPGARSGDRHDPDLRNRVGRDSAERGGRRLGPLPT